MEEEEEEKGGGSRFRLVSQQRPARLSPAPTLKSAVLTAKLLLYGVIGNGEIPPSKVKKTKARILFLQPERSSLLCARRQNRSLRTRTIEEPTKRSVANDIEMKSDCTESSDEWCKLLHLHCEVK